MTQVFLTVHAQKAMTARGVTFAEIEEVVLFPEVSYRGEAGDNSRILQRGEIAVVVKPLGKLGLKVVTVLWRETKQWTDEEMRAARAAAAETERG